MSFDSVTMVFDHLITPIVKIIDYFCSSPNDIQLSFALTWSILYPLVYYIVTLVLGLTVDNWYPYWFLDPTKLSWGMIAVWFVVLLIFYLGMAFAYYYMNKAIGKTKAGRIPAI